MFISNHPLHITSLYQLIRKKNKMHLSSYVFTSIWYITQVPGHGGGEVWVYGVEDPKNFRLISLVGRLYKLLANVLANRLC